MKEMNPNNMNQRISSCSLTGIVPVPASKSDGQRALLCAALAHGTTVLTNLGRSHDELAMFAAIQMLGAQIMELEENVFEIQGISTMTEKVVLNAGESGLGFRLLCGAAGSFEVEITLEGEGSLIDRPMLFFDRYFPHFGVQAKTTNGFLPVTIKGPYKTGKGVVDGSMSSQYISGMLIGLASQGIETDLEVMNLHSGAYVDLTIKTLKDFGVEVRTSNSNFQIAAGQQLRGTTYTVESDWSSASYWLVAAAIGHDLSLTGLNLLSKQADKALMEVLKLCGCEIQVNEENLRVLPYQLQSFQFDATDCPDLFPALVVLASQCEGTSKIFGVNRLKHKESNRGLVLKQEFGKLGLAIEIDEDVMTIVGPVRLVGGLVDAHNDHRIAMSLGIAASIAEGITEIVGAHCVSKSYPTFWEQFTALH